MRVVKPEQRRIRRTFQTGVWLQYQTSAHQQRLHVKLNHVQMDNQLPACVFPTVIAPVPPPKSVAAESGSQALGDFPQLYADCAKLVLLFQSLSRSSS